MFLRKTDITTSISLYIWNLHYVGFKNLRTRTDIISLLNRITIKQESTYMLVNVPFVTRMRASLQCFQQGKHFVSSAETLCFRGRNKLFPLLIPERKHYFANKYINLDASLLHSADQPPSSIRSIV